VLLRSDRTSAEKVKRSEKAEKEEEATKPLEEVEQAEEQVENGRRRISRWWRLGWKAKRGKGTEV